MLSCFLFSGDAKEFGSTLEVRGLKERTQSLSNVDILISPCDSDHRPTHTCPADMADANVEKPTEKTRLEAAASFPLERSKVTQYTSAPTLSGFPSSNRKSVSSIVYIPAHQDQEGVTSLTPPSSQQASQSPSMPHWGIHPSHKVMVEKSGCDETKQEVEETTSGPSDGDQRGEMMVDSNHGNGGGGVLKEELLVGEDRMYPTLRSKSLNTNPRKTRTKRKESEETPRLTGSVRDLVSAFSSEASVQDQVQRL